MQPHFFNYYIPCLLRLGGGGGSALAARLGVKGGVKKSFGGAGGVVGDARQRIIQANRVKTGDARWVWLGSEVTICNLLFLAVPEQHSTQLTNIFYKGTN